MSTAIDPYRVLGVSQGASEAEIKRAYRQLAKRLHPDAGAGSVARFLQLQAAYELLVGRSPEARTGARRGTTGDGRATAGGASRHGGRSGGWRDPGPMRRERTHAEPAGAPPPGTEWARQGRPSGPAGGRDRGPDGAPAGRAGSGGTEGTQQGSARPDAAGPGARPQPKPRRPSGESGAPGRSRRRRATLGSTSYDGAEPGSAPSWDGAGWYGPSSGTYWTLNPKEYADPRKHGPDYQARARKAAGADEPPGADESPGDLQTHGPDEPPGDPRTPGDPPSPGAGATGPRPGRRRVDEGEAIGADDSRGNGPGERRAPRPEWEPAQAPTGADPRRDGWKAGWAGSSHRPGDARPAFAGVAADPHAASAGGASARAGTAARLSTSWSAAAPPLASSAWLQPPRRVGLGVAAWLVPGVALAAAFGLPAGLIATLPLQVFGLSLAVRFPRLAWLGAVGLAGVAVAWVPAVVVLAAFGEPGGPAGLTGGDLGALAVIAWVGGVVVAGTWRVLRPPWRPGE